MMMFQPEQRLGKHKKNARFAPIDDATNRIVDARRNRCVENAVLFLSSFVFKFLALSRARLNT
jgi:hypothetical protein